MLILNASLASNSPDDVMLTAQPTIVVSGNVTVSER